MGADTTVLVLGTLTGEQDENAQPMREYRVAVVQSDDNVDLDPSDPEMKDFRDHWLRANFADVIPVTQRRRSVPASRYRDVALTRAAELYSEWERKDWIIEHGLRLVELDEPFPT